MGNPAEAVAEPATGKGPAPPTYTEATAESSTGTQAQEPPEYEAPVPMSSVTSPYRPFPSSVVTAYYQVKMTMTFHLGEETDKQMFAARAHNGMTGKGIGRPGIILHNGPTTQDPILAAAGEENLWNRHSLNSIITLPPLPGSPEPTSTEVMRASRKLGSVCWGFTIEVGQGEKMRREAFEWRKSKDGEDKDLVESPWKPGFKLVRLSGQADGGGSASSSANDGKAAASTTDGHEVVAVFAWGSNLALLTPFRIHLLGSGLGGALGERWAVMTFVTALRLWCFKHQGKTSERSVAIAEAGVMHGAPR